MDSLGEVGKVFVGGIGIDTTEKKLKDHFRQFGVVTNAEIVREKHTSKSRGFGFVSFSDPSVVETVIQQTHIINSRTLEVRKSLQRKEWRDFIGRSTSEYFDKKKIFVGGLASTSTKDDLIKYFAEYGVVSEAVVIHNHITGQSRGFGFIIFEKEDAVDKAVQKVYHNLNEKRVEVKRARAKDVARILRGNQTGNNRAMPSSQPTGSRGYSPYFRYGTSSYSSGVGNSSFNYGAYGGYGVNGYGNPSIGYTVPSRVPYPPDANFLRNQRPPGPIARPNSSNANTLRNQWPPGYVVPEHSQTAGYSASASFSGVPENESICRSLFSTWQYGNPGYSYNNTYGRAGGPYADGRAAANTEHHSGGNGYMRRS